MTVAPNYVSLTDACSIVLPMINAQELLETQTACACGLSYSWGLQASGQKVRWKDEQLME
jgi:hypothetical protein